MTAKQLIAERLLRETNLPISKIADKLGYNEPGDFARSFRQWTGARPTDYRGRLRDTNI